MPAVFDTFAEYIRDFLDDHDLTDNVIGTWVDMAESRFNDELRCREMVKRVRVLIDDQCVPLPDDFLEMIVLTYTDSGLPLRYIAIDAYERLRSANAYSLSGPQTTAITYLDPTTGQMIGPLPRQPAFIDYGSRGPSRIPLAQNAYTIIGLTLFVHPTVNPVDVDIVPTELEMAYYAKVPPLTQWDTPLPPPGSPVRAYKGPPVFERNKRLYAYGTLAASAPYLVEDDRSAMWDGTVTAIIKQMNDAAHIARVASSPTRIQVRTFG